MTSETSRSTTVTNTRDVFASFMSHSMSDDTLLLKYRLDDLLICCKWLVNSSCEGTFSQHCNECKRQVTCCHIADYKAFLVPSVIKEIGWAQRKAFCIDETVLTVVEALPVWVYILWGLWGINIAPVKVVLTEADVICFNTHMRGGFCCCRHLCLRFTLFYSSTEFISLLIHLFGKHTVYFFEIQ